MKTNELRQTIKTALSILIALDLKERLSRRDEDELMLIEVFQRNYRCLDFLEYHVRDRDSVMREGRHLLIAPHWIEGLCAHLIHLVDAEDRQRFEQGMYYEGIFGSGILGQPLREAVGVLEENKHQCSRAMDRLERLRGAIRTIAEV